MVPDLNVIHKRHMMDTLCTVLSSGSTNTSLEQAQIIKLPNIFPDNMLAGIRNNIMVVIRTDTTVHPIVPGAAIYMDLAVDQMSHF